MKKNRSFIVINVMYALIFLGMMINIVWFMLFHSQEAITNSYNNKRLDVLAAQNYRGTIYAASGEILAETMLDVSGNEIRKYPYGDLFAHAVGYASNGGAGIEAMANINLINSSIGLSERVDNEINGVKNPGDSVYSTLDMDLQQIAYDSLGMYRGAIIVTEVKTGRILAMVSKPGFDPNEIDVLWPELVEDQESTILLNRATQGLYPPGSTFKIIVALEYIRENPDTYMNYTFNCNGSITRDVSRINCYHGANHGSLDLTSSFAKSCNSSFANIGLTLDRSRFADTLLSLLFNSELPVDMPYSQSHISMRSDMTTMEMMQTSIGQSETVMTPLHLNMITAAIANQGVMMQPYMIDSVVCANGTIVVQNTPIVYGTVMSAEETTILTAMMVEVVEHGTATKLSGQNYTAAGKTGSAEYSDNTGESHAWFTGFAPVEDPQIAVTIILESAGAGGDYSAPIARRIFSKYFE